VNKKNKLEDQANKKIDRVMSLAEKLIDEIDDLNRILNHYRGLGVGPTERPFYFSKKFQWPLIHVKGLKMWVKEYRAFFGE